MTGIFQKVIELINLDYNRWIEYFNKSFLKCKAAFVMATSPADNNSHLNLRKVDIPDKKRNAPLRTVQLSGKSQVIGQFSLYQCKGMSVTAASHVFCNQASKLCS